MANETLGLVRTMAGPLSSWIAAALVSAVLAVPTAAARAEPAGRPGARTSAAAGPTASPKHLQSRGVREPKAQEGAGEETTNTIVAPPEQRTDARGDQSAEHG